MRMMTHDAPSLALNFLRTAQNYIEPTIYKREYPDFQYRELVPVDTSAPEWTTRIDFFSMGDDVGEAREFAPDADDIPFVDFQLDKGDSRVFMAGIGYRYNLQELAHAQAYGVRLDTDRADAARRKYELFVDQVAFVGRAKLGLTGLVYSTSVTALAAANGVSGTATWETKTSDEIVKDVNRVLSAVFIGSNGIEQADTLTLPHSLYEIIAIGPILITAHGKPFAKKGLGNKMADAFDAAGLPKECVTHGLRKAAARRLADAGCSTHEIASVTGHKSLAEIERYTKEANQRRLSDSANSRLPIAGHPNQFPKPAEN